MLLLTKRNLDTETSLGIHSAFQGLIEIPLGITRKLKIEERQVEISPTLFLKYHLSLTPANISFNNLTFPYSRGKLCNKSYLLIPVVHADMWQGNSFTITVKIYSHMTSFIDIISVHMVSSTLWSNYYK